MFEEMGNVEVDSGNKPLVIRGHHLDHFAHLLWIKEDLEKVYGCSNPNEAAAESFVDEICTKISTNKRTYKEDVLGKTEADKESFRSKCLQVMRDFLSSPDDQLVKIVASEPDVICGCCVLGNHCTKMPPANFEGEALNLNTDRFIMTNYFGNLEPGFTINLGELKEILLDTHAREYPNLHDRRL
jgi:hypothetical protein